MNGAGFASYQTGGQVREFVYLGWPESTRGLMSPFLQSANVRAAMAVVPDDVSSLSVGGIDMTEAWERATSFVEESFPSSVRTMQLAVSQFENLVGVPVPAFLSSFGSDFVSYSAVRPGGRPASVFLVSLKDHELLRRVDREQFAIV